jgi:hypothetical protein
MIVQSESTTTLRPDQVRAMAQGLYHFAQVDGIDDREREAIASFLRDGGVDMEVEALSKIPFTIGSLLESLDTVFLRKVFLRASVIVLRADETISSNELGELRRIAVAIGIDEPIESLIEDLPKTSL